MDIWAVPSFGELCKVQLWTCVCIFECLFSILGGVYIAKSAAAGSYNSMFNFLRNHQTVLHSSWTNFTFLPAINEGLFIVVLNIFFMLPHDSNYTNINHSFPAFLFIIFSQILFFSCISSFSRCSYSVQLFMLLLVVSILKWFFPNFFQSSVSNLLLLWVFLFLNYAILFILFSVYFINSLQFSSALWAYFSDMFSLCCYFTLFIFIFLDYSTCYGI